MPDSERSHLRLSAAAEAYVEGLEADVKQLRAALDEQVATWLTISPVLEAHVYEPNASGHVWNAWTRWGERAAERAQAALDKSKGGS